MNVAASTPCSAEALNLEALERACPELMAALCERARATVIAEERERIRKALPLALQWPQLATTTDHVLFVKGGTLHDLAMALLGEMRRVRLQVAALVDAGERRSLPCDERKPE